MVASSDANANANAEAEPEAGRVKRDWPWEWIGKQACKTSANCKCSDGKNWAKCVKSEGYAASNCCDKNYVWACCGKKPQH
uniref:Uncharacterized protein n=1 Tax=Globodera rostochiensis TaxID=31243 RepID=A0A914I087_GLORO